MIYTLLSALPCVTMRLRIFGYPAYPREFKVVVGLLNGNLAKVEDVYEMYVDRSMFLTHL